MLNASLHYASHPPHIVLKKLGFWEFIITCLILGLAHERLKLRLRQTSPFVVAEVSLYANIWGTYHRKGYLINGRSWILTDTLPNLSASNVTSKLCSDMLGEWSPEEPSKEEIEGTKRQKINGVEKHGLMIVYREMVCWPCAFWYQFELEWYYWFLQEQPDNAPVASPRRVKRQRQKKAKGQKETGWEIKRSRRKKTDR